MNQEVYRIFPSAFKNSRYCVNTCNNREAYNFLVFGVKGFVHKGNDLLIEVFSQHPEWKLYMCGGEIKEECRRFGIYIPENVIDCGFVNYDALEFLKLLTNKLSTIESDLKNQYSKWILQCQVWKDKYPVVEKRHYDMEKPLNVYAFIDSFSRKLPEGMVTVVANGSASVVGSAAYYIKKNQRFIMNCAISSMGYDLPAAVGASVANNNEPIVCIAGDGSIMMNLQELQTIVTNKLPVKIILINNDGYQQIRLTQTNLFKKDFVGIGPESNDLGFPDFGKVAKAFGIPYRRCDSKAQMDNEIEWIISESGYCMLEVVCSTEQAFEPKSATKRMEDGSLYSPPLEDLAPFLSREELKSNMYIKMWDER